MSVAGFSRTVLEVGYYMDDKNLRLVRGLGLELHMEGKCADTVGTVNNRQKQS